MIHILIIIAIVLAPSAQEKQEPSEHLKPLSWLVGTWEGKGKYGEMEFTDTLDYKWTHKKNFIKWSAEASMDGKVVHSETGMMGYDKAKKKLVWFSFGIDGTIGHAEDEGSKEKNTWVFTGSVGDQPPWNETRGITKKIDDDTFESEVQTKKDGKWVTFFKGTYKRKKKDKK